MNLWRCIIYCWYLITCVYRFRIASIEELSLRGHRTSMHSKADGKSNFIPPIHTHMAIVVIVVSNCCDHWLIALLVAMFIDSSMTMNLKSLKIIVK
jgi:hypothetical protein